MRIDLALVEKKLVSSRSQAQQLITEGYAYILKANQPVQILKSNYQLNDSEFVSLYLKENLLQKFVSRGGLKLEFAILKTKINIQDIHALDVGQSTGGFTDCLLQYGAKKIIGIDVGHDQLHENLKTNSKVISIEGIHVKDLAQNETFNNNKPENGFDLIVMDVSFISITKVMLHLKQQLKLNGYYLFLVKPQFELTAKDLDRNGIVKDVKKYSLVQESIEQEARQQFGNVLDYFKSETLGKDGNQEFFIYGQKTIS